MLPPVNRIRAEVNLRPVASIDEFLRRAPLMLVASDKPFQYPQTDWGDAVQMIGPCPLDPGPNDPRLAGRDRAPDRPGHASSEKQADDRSCPTALADWPMGRSMWSRPCRPGNPMAHTVTQCDGVRFDAQRVVLDRAVCAVTHGGMGATRRRSLTACRCVSSHSGVTSSRSRGALK